MPLTDPTMRARPGMCDGACDVGWMGRWFVTARMQIGDYALLVSGGASSAQALGFQIVTAIFAFAGTGVVFLFGDLSVAAAAYLLPFTAGGFIYIATVQVIPGLMEETSFKQTIKEVRVSLILSCAFNDVPPVLTGPQVIALCAGVGMMVVIGLFE